MAKQTPLTYLLLRPHTTLGPLRSVLAVLAIILLVLTPAPGTAAFFSGWALFHTVIIPVLAPLVFMVLMLDTLMSWVFRIDKRGEERRRLSMVIAIDLLLVLAIVARWLPYFQALGK